MIKKIFSLLFAIGLIVIFLKFIPIKDEYGHFTKHINILNFDENKNEGIIYIRLVSYFIIYLLSIVSLYYISGFISTFLKLKSHKQASPEYANLISNINSKLSFQILKNLKPGIVTNKEFLIKAILVLVIVEMLFLLLSSLNSISNLMLLIFIAVYKTVGLIAYKYKKEAAFNIYFIGQIFSIFYWHDYSLPAIFVIILLEISILIILCYIDDLIIKFAKNSVIKCILILILYFTFLDLINSLQSLPIIESSDPKFIILLFFVVTITIELYGLIKIFNGEKLGFKFFIIGKLIEFILSLGLKTTLIVGVFTTELSEIFDAEYQLIFKLFNSYFLIISVFIALKIFFKKYANENYLL